MATKTVINRPGSDAHIVYKLLKKELLDFKVTFAEDSVEPELDTIWVESTEFKTWMTVEDKALWIEDDCQEHLDFDDCRGCEPDSFVIPLADPKFTIRVNSILYRMEARRTALRSIKEDPFAIVDRDIRISELEELLKKNKIRIPKK